MYKHILAVYFFEKVGGSMASWRYEPFEVPIDKMSFIELAEWIIRCRNYIKQENFNNEEDYLYHLEEFFLEWQEHYKENENLYKSRKYKKALIFCTLKDRLKFRVDFGKGFEEADYNTYQSVMNSIFAEKIEKEILVIAEDYYKEISQVFAKENRENYKAILHNEIILKQAFAYIRTTYRVYKDGKKVKTSSYKELLEQMKSGKGIVIEPETRHMKKAYSQVFDNFDIPKSTYNEFTNEFYCQKAFDKKIFINLSFALGLPYSFSETLLKYNGFSLDGQGRIFEDVCSIAFKLGCDRKMVISIIEKRNSENLAFAEKRKAKEKSKELNFGEIPNLTKNKT